MRFSTRRFFLISMFAGLLGLVAAILQLSPQATAQSTSRGIDPANMCNTCNACEDFYLYANGGWLAKNEIPAAFSTWGTTSNLREKNVGVLRQILEEAAKNTAAPKDSLEQKTGDFYASCMDEQRIEAAGAKPLAAELAAISKMKSVKDLPAAVGRLHNMRVGSLFGFGAVQDFKNSSVVNAIARQGGLGLPDRDFYLKDDEKSKSIREAYVKHVANMFKLLGDDATKADAQAQVVLKIETELANNSLDRVARRDLTKQYNKMTVTELAAVTPDFEWNAYLKALNAPKFTDINMSHPAFFKGLNAMLSTVALDDWKTYLRWHLVHDAADALSSNFVNENFSFYGTTLNGTKELLPRWRRCVVATDQTLGELLGQVYVKKAFPPEAKARMKELVNNLVAALRDDINTLDWMSEPTQKQAIAKLESFAVKIGYPDKWRDYSTLKIDRNSYADNLIRAGRFEVHRNLAKMGRPVDRTEWGMTPPTVNAYYNPLMGEIVFPAGILQPPYFDLNADDAVNYGAIGGVIGHELSHGFDDQGRKFDMKGNMADWWTAEDAKNYLQRATCVEEQFSAFRAEEVGMNQNGKLVLGESIGDLGGLKIAWLAFQKSLEGNRVQRTSMALLRNSGSSLVGRKCGQEPKPEAIRQQILTDPHPLGRFRVNGPISNMPQFAEAFNCKLGDKMVRPPDKRCQVW